MKPLIAEYRRQIQDLKKKLMSFNVEREAEQKTITLFLKNEGEIIDPFSAGKPSESAEINPAVIEYLESMVTNFTRGKKAIIEIEYGGTIPDDPFLPEKLIKKNLKVSLLASLRQNTKIMRSSFALALVGIAILGLIDRIPYFNSRYAFNELFVVISWVFIWRFVDMFFFERKKIQLKLRRLFKIFFAEYRIKRL